MKYKTFSTLVILAFLALVGCGDRSKTQDPITGNIVQKTCINQLTGTDDFRGEFKFLQTSGYFNIPTKVGDGSKRVIRLYNETTCSSRKDNDWFGATDSYFTLNDTFLSTEVAHGSNKVHFVVEECTSFDKSNDFSCVSVLNRDAGYFLLMVP